MLVQGWSSFGVGVEVVADDDQGLCDEVEVRVGLGISGDGDAVLLSFRSGWCGGVAAPPLSGDLWFLLPCAG
ncbi:MAG: hypothetical protein ACRDRO_22530 [Pseudonocardiaceae bacterium]